MHERVESIGSQSDRNVSTSFVQRRPTRESSRLFDLTDSRRGNPRLDARWSFSLGYSNIDDRPPLIAIMSKSTTTRAALERAADGHRFQTLADIVEETARDKAVHHTVVE